MCAVTMLPSERRIAIRLGEGKDPSHIARELGVKRSTVVRAIHSIQRKTKMNLIELAVHFSKQGEFYHA